MPTPIKVRGKRKRGARLLSQSAPPSVTPATTDGSLTDTITPPTERKKKKKRRRVVEALAQRRHVLSPLERLPAELIQPVLVLSMNVNLALASPFICAKVSHQSVYVALFDRVFSHNVYGRWPWHVGQPPSDVASPARLQSAVLSRRWMTLAFWKEHKELVSNDRFRYGTRIPTGLLHPPFTSDKAILLDGLTWYGAQLDLKSSIDGEVAADGLRAAIEQGNILLMRLLLRLGTLVTPDMLHVVVASSAPQPSKWSMARYLLEHLVDTIKTSQQYYEVQGLLSKWRSAELPDPLQLKMDHIFSWGALGGRKDPS